MGIKNLSNNTNNVSHAIERISEVAAEVGGSEETAGGMQEEGTDSLQGNSQPGQCFEARHSVLDV